MSKIHILHGQEAVSTYEEGGILEVRKAYKRKDKPIEWAVSWIDLDEQTSPKDIVIQTICACDGYTASITITEQEYKQLNNSRK